MTLSVAAEPVASRPPTALVLLGYPVAHSLSPRFQQAALDAAGLPVAYRTRETPPSELLTTLAALAGERTAGNVTVPLKEAVFAQCRHHTAVARRVGAVNTFWHTDDGELIGHNTDVHGARVAMNAVHLAASVERADAPRVLLLGAGGAAASVLVALQESTWAANATPEVTMVVRSPERAHRLAERCGVTARISRLDDAALAAAAATADLVINATPIGLHDAGQPVPVSGLAPCAAVLDLVYRPGETAWVRAAKARGHPAEDGLRMLVEQGAAAFQAWFGQPPSRDAMWGALEPRSVSPDRS